MKNIAIITLIVLAISEPVFAERGKRGQHMDRMIQNLNLTEEQEPAVRQILEEQHTKFRSEMQSVRDQAQPRMEALKAETSQRLSTVLNTEQLQTFNSNMEKRQQKMQERRNRWHNRGQE